MKPISREKKESMKPCTEIQSEGVYYELKNKINNFMGKRGSIVHIKKYHNAANVSCHLVENDSNNDIEMIKDSDNCFFTPLQQEKL